MLKTIQDDEGRTWRLRVTIGGVRQFEQQTDVKIFARLYALWQKHRNDAENDPLNAILASIAELLPGVEDAAAFVYSCASVEGGDKPSFEQFCDSVSLIACGKAAVDLVRELQDEFMPEAPTDLKGSAGPLGQ